MSISAITYIGGKDAGKVRSESDYLAKLRNNQVTGQLNPQDILSAREQVLINQLMRSGNANEMPWNLAGPNNMGGRTRAILFDNQDPTGNTIYAGSVYGGMFKTINGGFDWEKINLSAGNLNVSCITQAPDGAIIVGTGEGFTNEEYSVLGEWGYSSGFIGQGIFRSTDGENFTLIPSTKPMMNGNEEMEWGFINKVAATAGNRIYAATNTGLKYSDNGGDSWAYAMSGDTAELNMVSKEIEIGSDGLVIAEVDNLCYVSESGNPGQFMLVSGDSTWNLPSGNAGRMEFAISPSDPNIIYALVVNTSGALLNVYRSDDRGMNWRIIGPGMSSSFNVFNTGSNIGAGNGLYSCVMEVFPTNPDRVLVGGLNMWEGRKITEEGYFDWQMRSESATLPTEESFLPSNHHTYKFIPGTSDECFMGTNGGIFKGKLAQLSFVFQPLNKNYTSSQFYALSASKDKLVVLGGAQDLGSVLVNGVLNAANPKRGEDIWTTVAGLPDGATGTYSAKSIIFPDIAIYSRVPHPAKSGNLETFVRRNEYGGGPDWAAPDRMFNDEYASTAFLSPFVLWESFEDYNSRDSVPFETFVDIPAGTRVPIESQNGNRIFFHVFPEGLSAGDSVMVQDIIASKFFIGGDDQVMMTKEILKFDRDPEWYEISNATSGFTGTPQSMAYSADANHLFVGTLEGGLYRMSNIAYAWNFERADVSSPYCVISTTRIPVYLPGTTTEISQVITSVAVNPNNANQVVITLGNYGNEHYVYMTNNALDEIPEFHSIQGDPNNGGLPQMPAYASLFEMNPDNNLVFVGTEYGIYVSDNVESSQPTWVPENNNVGRVPVFQFKQQTIRKDNDTIVLINIDTTVTIIEGVDNYGVIYAATFGRGMIRLDEFQKPVGIFNPGQGVGKGPEFKVYPNPADDRTRVEFTLTSSSRVSIVMYDLSGNLIQTVDLGHLPSGKHNAGLNLGHLPSGTYILRMDTGNRSSSGKIIVY